MDLIERYLGAVRWNLPAGKADDILAELADVIASRIEDREEMLGRALTNSETSALLRDFGHPLVVAGGYSSHRVLIGPEIYPFYLFSLKLVLAISALIQIVAAGARMIFADGGALPQLFSQGTHGMITTLLLHAAIVTLVFAIVERTGWMTQYFERWKPEDLPRITLGSKGKKPLDAAFEIAGGIVFILWWVGAFTLPIASYDDRFRLDAAPIWATLYWPILALALAQLVHNFIGLLRPDWKPLRALLGIATTAAGLALLAMLYQAGRLVTLSSISIDAAETARIQHSLDLSIHISLFVCAAAWICTCLVELWRLRR